jgi:hypothetical protein
MNVTLSNTAGQGVSRTRRYVALSSVTALLAGIAVLSSGAMPAAAVPATSMLDGATSQNAASSCWEVKQKHPASGDGVYWLRNSSLERPEQFYCDMTSDGGGWVLVGRGREGWTFRDYGQSTPQNLADNPTGPTAFSPAALSTETIDQLLDGGDVKDLADGVRLRRALNVAGTTWQELRWNYEFLTSWSWAVGGGHRMDSFSIDGMAGTGSNTKDSKIEMSGESGAGIRSSTHADAWFTYPWSSHGGLAGFSYSGYINGENNSTSFLWELASEQHAIPFTQVYLRPQISTPSLAAIPDTGVPSQTLVPGLDDRPAEIAGGVRGVLKIGDSEPQVDAPVLAIATTGDRVYVGGKFSDVRSTATGSLEPHAYLAAFDRSTGAWIESFDPVLDGTVWDLKVVDNKLIVGGQFTNVNGTPLTAGLAAVDLATGATIAGWTASLSLSGSAARPYVRAIDIVGNTMYVGGNFSSISASSAETRSRGRVAAVAVSDGSSNNSFLPDLNNGTVYDIEANNGRVYIVGSFEGINGDPSRGVAVVDGNTGATVPGLADPVWTTSFASKQYQQAIAAVGDELWQGGSQHNSHVYSASSHSYLKGYVTSGRGGDTQAYSLNNGDMIQSSHGNSWIYEDARTWPGLLGYTRTDDYKWVGSFDTVTREYDKSFVPSLDSAFGEGVWELHTDVDGCTWFGGDIVGGPYVSGQRQYLEGFSRFCQRDNVAPSVPTNGAANAVAGNGIQIDWSASNDNVPGFIGYEVFRNDRVISPLVYGSRFTDPAGGIDDRYFVRAKDPAGNRSATTSVLVPGDNIAPTTPQDLAGTVEPDQSIQLTWTASSDDVAVTEYLIYRNGVVVRTVNGSETGANVAGLGTGSHWMQVRAVDGSGNESFKTPPVRLDTGGADAQRPSVPGDLAAPFDETTGIITASWTASQDDIGVTSYEIRRNGTVVATVDGATTTVDLDLGPGEHYIQVQAFDAAENASYKTAPVFVEVVIIGGPDTENPTTPADLTGVVDTADNSIDMTWTASVDNVGVDFYEVRRNGVVIATVDGSNATANLSGLGEGNHYIQVQAFDAASNASFKTPPTMITIAGGDTVNPSSPEALVAVVEADESITLTWTASTDNVGVTGYRILRNLDEVGIVAGNETTANIAGLGSGDHYMQVQALDAAGNESFRTSPVLVTI